MLQGAWAQVLTGLTGHHDVAFGTTVSGRPAEIAGAESMVGLFINTVPVRASITPATTTADLLRQLQDSHTHTLEHQHVTLGDIHRIVGHEQLFDTLFVYENYPIDASIVMDETWSSAGSPPASAPTTRSCCRLRPATNSVSSVELPQRPLRRGIR